jgi:hypothetical protein
MTAPQKKRKVKKVKAWAIIDNTGYFIVARKEKLYAKKHIICTDDKLIPCTITYKVATAYDNQLAVVIA